MATHIVLGAPDNLNTKFGLLDWMDRAWPHASPNFTLLNFFSVGTGNRNVHYLSRYLGFVDLTVTTAQTMSRDSAVGIVTGYGLDDQGVGVRVLVAGSFFTSPRRPERL
jgi:hypothetical protein